MPAKYRVRLMFEWGGGCVWCGNEAALSEFDVGSIECKLPLSESLLARLGELSKWHDGALDWDYPPDPSPWSTEERSRFESEATTAFESLKVELGDQFEVVYEPL